MATMSVYWFGKGLEHFKRGNVDWIGDTIKVALFTGTFSPNQDTDEFFNSLTNEVSGASEGYTTGGEVLANKTLTYAARVVTLDGDDVSYDDGGSSAITAQYAVIYVDGTTPGTDDYVLGYGDLGAEQTSDGAPWAVNWHLDGILRTTATQQV